MSPTGFRWFVCTIVAVLVVIMLVVVRGNAAWPARAPGAGAGERHGALSGARPSAVMTAAPFAPESRGPAG
jgi:hypothetical protein